MVRFLHTSDLQLGMTRHFLDEGAQARFSQARFDALRTVGRVAGEVGASFVVIAGDVFESNHVKRQTVRRALEALRSIEVPVCLLPGNHDPLNPASVFRSNTFRREKPENVHVLEDEEPFEIVPGTEVMGAPWRSKQPLEDLVSSATGGLEAESSRFRVVVGHGIVDDLSPDKENPALIGLKAMESAILEGKVHYFALGDRHSVTSVGQTGRIWYSGSPEPTDFNETRPGYVLAVDLDPGHCRVEEYKVGTWEFHREVFELAGDADLKRVQDFLDDIVHKETVVLKLGLRGTLSLAGKSKLDRTIQKARELFAAVETWERKSDLVVEPTADDLEKLNLSGFARNALETLREHADGEGTGARTAQDALALLYRLARG